MDCDLDETKATKNKEKSADELFKELGYEKVKETGYGEETPYRIKYKKDDDNVYIFYKRYKTYSKMGEWDGMCGDVTMQELQAINKKVEELGWK